MTSPRCTTLRVLMSMFFVALRVASVDVVRRQQQKVVVNSEAQFFGGGANCPSAKQPKLTFNHITKTGGAAVGLALRAIVPDKFLTIQEDYPAELHLTPQDKQNTFVIGLVRRPCDFLVSWYYQLKPDNIQKEYGMPNFTEYVYKEGWGPAHMMSDAIDFRYQSGDNVHCMMRTHNLEAEMVDCINQYRACGGAFRSDTNPNLKNQTVAEAVKGAFAEAEVVAHQAGRSVGDHPPCSELFNKDMERDVLKTEQRVIDEFKLGKCCSS